MIRTAGTVVLMAATLAAATPAPASPLTAERAAVASLIDTQQRNAAAGRPLPRLTDPDAGPLLRTAFDERAVPEMNPDDGVGGLSVCRGPMTLINGYLYDGMREVAHNDPATLTRAQVTRLNNNIVRYQDEVILGLRFTTTCLAYLTPGLSRLWDTLPEAERAPSRNPGLLTLRNSIEGTFEGALRDATDPTGVNPANRSLLLEALVRNGPALIGVMSPAGRGRLRAVIDRFAPSISGPDHAQALTLRRMLDDIPCLGLCAL